MIIEEVVLQTSALKELKVFYVQTLGFRLAKETKDSFTVTVGESSLTFVQTDDNLSEPPFYHFAININEAQFKRAKEYLSQRVSLLQEESQDEFEFTNWNAHAVYFYDPAGNIVEYIARHNLKQIASATFSDEDILGISEVGLPVTDVSAAASWLERNLSLPRFTGDGKSFQPMGNEHGLFILVSLDRNWFPTQHKAKVFPITVKIKGNGRSLAIPDSPYNLR